MRRERTTEMQNAPTERLTRTSKPVTAQPHSYFNLPRRFYAGKSQTEYTPEQLTSRESPVQLGRAHARGQAVPGLRTGEGSMGGLAGAGSLASIGFEPVELDGYWYWQYVFDGICLLSIMFFSVSMFSVHATMRSCRMRRCARGSASACDGRARSAWCR